MCSVMLQLQNGKLWKLSVLFEHMSWFMHLWQGCQAEAAVLYIIQNWCTHAWSADSPSLDSHKWWGNGSMARNVGNTDNTNPKKWTPSCGSTIISHAINATQTTCLSHQRENKRKKPALNHALFLWPRCRPYILQLSRKCTKGKTSVQISSQKWIWAWHCLYHSPC